METDKVLTRDQIQRLSLAIDWTGDLSDHGADEVLRELGVIRDFIPNELEGVIDLGSDALSFYFFETEDGYVYLTLEEGSETDEGKEVYYLWNAGTWDDSDLEPINDEPMTLQQLKETYFS